MKILFGYMMPIWYMVFGVVSEDYLQITEPVYYASIAYIMGVVSTLLISHGVR